MCGFIFSQQNIDSKLNKFCRFRGPDHTSCVSLNGCYFVHNLLSITGPQTIQPFVKGDIACLYNGEIYNATGYNSDGECLIDFYAEYGDIFPQYLDGEFALVLIDFKQSKIIVSTDSFGTKPLWFATQPFFCAGSYRSCIDNKCLDIRRMQPNSTIVYNFSTKTIKTHGVVAWDLNQHKKSFDDWILSFEKSIQKRTKCTKGIFVGLSSGYDSGAIACECQKQKVCFKTYSIIGNEDEDILNKRMSLHTSGKVLARELEVNKVRQLLDANIENAGIDSFGSKDYDVKKDKAHIALGLICHQARLDNNIVHISGQGADEIISDYGFKGEKIYKHSQIGGLFPKDLSKVFPWNNFYSGAQNWYLTKEEFVAGVFGIESRYPFLDKSLVQEFLWLSSKLKNSEYKAPLREYLIMNKYPCLWDDKRGFNYKTNIYSKKKVFK